ncbi:MAG: hypothetical protein NC320_13410, partial [Clostridium sp.]|nr:hypothetical protein [Clostridium sp.]
MDVSYYLNGMSNLNYCGIPDKKDVVTIIAKYVICEKPIVFDGSVPYVRMDTHYEYIDYEDTSSIIRNLITSDDRLSVSSG